MRKRNVISVAIGLCLVMSQLAVAQYDGSLPLLCASSTVIECGTSGECQRGTVESANIPPFVKIDFEAKLLRAANSDRTTAIKHLEHLDGRLILQGGQGGRGWSIVIAEDTGKMSVAVSEDQAGFIIFGACTPL
jgi:hypothetical protein